MEKKKGRGERFRNLSGEEKKSVAAERKTTFRDRGGGGPWQEKKGWTRRQRRLTHREGVALQQAAGKLRINVLVKKGAARKRRKRGPSKEGGAFFYFQLNRGKGGHRGQRERFGPKAEARVPVFSEKVSTDVKKRRGMWGVWTSANPRRIILLFGPKRGPYSG